MTAGRYILEGHQPVPCDNLTKWARWFEKSENRRVALDHVGPIMVSTVFLGLGHIFSCLLASWMLSIEADNAEATRLLRAAAMHALVQEVIQMVQEHEEMLENPQ